MVVVVEFFNPNHPAVIEPIIKRRLLDGGLYFAVAVVVAVVFLKRESILGRNQERRPVPHLVIDRFLFRALERRRRRFSIPKKKRKLASSCFLISSSRKSNRSPLARLTIGTAWNHRDWSPEDASILQDALHFAFLSMGRRAQPMISSSPLDRRPTCRTLKALFDWRSN